MAIRKDFTGIRFGRLIVLGDAPNRGKHRYVQTQCDCGEQKEVLLFLLKNGQTTSCGCRKAEVCTSHGKTGTPLYRVWTNMRSRCNDPNAKYFPDYGGRGIKVTPEWDSFENFADWAAKTFYTVGLTIDRRDNSKGYSPSNCHWVDRAYQQRNRRGQKGSSSKFTGVSWHSKTGKWLSSIKHDGKAKNLGYFTDEIAAAKARDHYIKQHCLTGFILNFPQ